MRSYIDRELFIGTRDEYTDEDGVSTTLELTGADSASISCSVCFFSTNKIQCGNVPCSGRIAGTPFSSTYWKEVDDTPKVSPNGGDV